MSNLATMLTETAAQHGDRIAIQLDDLELNYGLLEQAAQRVAGMLEAKGVQPGDRIGLMLPNVPFFPFLFYGALRLGAAVVPLNPLLKGREVGFHLKDSGAKLLYAWDGFAEAAQAGAQEAGAECVLVGQDFGQAVMEATPREEITDRAEDDLGIILYTSGTTGTPKGAELTHGNLQAATQISVDLVQSSAEDVIFGALPLFHVFGLTCGLNSAVKVGARLTLLPRFDPAKALEIVARDRVTTFLGVPTMYAAMIHDASAAQADTSSLRYCISGGSAMPVEILKAFEQQFGCAVLEGYGLSETCAISTFNQLGQPRKPGSIGTPVGPIELRLLDAEGAIAADGEIGEIAVRGPVVMKGYYEREDATKDAIDAEGWFKTGDLAKVDDDGYYFIVDRKKEMIIRGGFNVYPREIEEVLYEHPAVREAAVIGLPDDSLGEEIGAAVALKEGEDATSDDVRAFVKERVAAYKYPRKVWFVDELPKGPTGKILKREIEAPQ